MKIIKFSSVNCRNCKLLIPIYEKLKEEYKDIEFIEVDVEEQPDFATDYWIMMLPTLVLQDWIISKSIYGIKPLWEYKKEIDLFLNK